MRNNASGVWLHYDLHGDHLGSTVLITHQGGGTISNQGYYAFGRYRYGGSLITDHKFTGQKLDATGLYNYGARYYDPTLGRFIQPDTIVPNPGEAQSFDRYAYVNNNPLKYTDPSGHCVNSTTQDAGTITYDNDACWALANTIANMWDSTDYWKNRFTSKAVFLNDVANNGANGTDFFQSQVDFFLNSEDGKAWIKGSPCTACYGPVEQDFGDYTSFTLVLPIKVRQSDIGFTEFALIMDDHWNFYRRIGPGIGTPGISLSRGDVLIFSEGKYIDIDTLNLAADQESLLMLERMPGASRGLSAGTSVFAGGGAISADGQTVTVEAGFTFPPSGVSGFLAPNSVTTPWFSWR